MGLSAWSLLYRHFESCTVHCRLGIWSLYLSSSSESLHPLLGVGHGVFTGDGVGDKLGFRDGKSVGPRVGVEVGVRDGMLDGPRVGDDVGSFDGTVVGLRVGASDEHEMTMSKVPELTPVAPSNTTL